MTFVLKKLFAFSVLFAILISCTTTENDFFTIDVDSAKEQPLLLSEIAEKVEVIELEMTDNSLLKGSNSIERVICTEEYIIVFEFETIMLFDKTGKFIRQIGSKGQGPGEFLRITSATADLDNKLIYVSASDKIICYDFTGRLIKEVSIGKDWVLRHINYMNNNLLYLSRAQEKVNEESIFQTKLFTIDNNLLVSDSIEIRKEIDYLYQRITIDNSMGGDYICCDGVNTFLYNSYPISETLLDTLYQLKDNRITPFLKLKFNDADYKNRVLTFDIQQPQKFLEELKRIMSIHKIYKSSRYVFSTYSHRENSYCFFYDIKTGEGYKDKGGYTDDIHTGEKVKIRPFNVNANMFYYLHTKIDDSTLEEPNPTLYIGTLKKP